jgi:hypothetical protein
MPGGALHGRYSAHGSTYVPRERSWRFLEAEKPKKSHRIQAWAVFVAVRCDQTCRRSRNLTFVSRPFAISRSRLSSFLFSCPSSPPNTFFLKASTPQVCVFALSMLSSDTQKSSDIQKAETPQGHSSLAKTVVQVSSEKLSSVSAQAAAIV